VGQGNVLDGETIKDKALVLRMDMLSTDLGSLIGWITDEKEDEKKA
jgi:hypothetical protein